MEWTDFDKNYTPRVKSPVDSKYEVCDPNQDILQELFDFTDYFYKWYGTEEDAPS